MPPRTVSVLFAIGLLLTSFHYFFLRDPEILHPRVGAAFRPTIGYGELEEIELIPGASSRVPGVDARPILLKKRPEAGGGAGEGRWWIETPSVPANPARMESIGYSLIELQVIADVPLADESRVFPPEGPDITVRFRARGGAEHLVELGRDHPDQDLTYARLDRSRLVLLRKEFRKNVRSRLDDLRSRALFPVPRDRVERLEVDGDPRWALAVRREGNRGQWRFERPEPAPAHREALDRLLDDLNAWRIEGFVRDEEGDLGPFGLARPRLTISLVEKSGERTALEIGDDAPPPGGAAKPSGSAPAGAGAKGGAAAGAPRLVYVKWSGKPFVMSVLSGPLEILEKSPEHLYSEHVLQLGAEEVEELKVSGIARGLGGDYAIRRAKPPAAGGAAAKGAVGREARGEEGWAVEVQEGKETFAGDPLRIRRLFDLLLHLPIKRYLPEPKAGDSPPVPPRELLAALELVTDTQNRRRLRFEKPLDPAEVEGRITLVIADGEPFIFQVVSPVVEDLLAGGFKFRASLISTIDPERVRELDLSRRVPGGEEAWVIGRPADLWRLEEGLALQLKAEKAIDFSRVNDVIQSLAQGGFRVQEWLPGETDLAAREIDAKGYQLRLRLREEDVPQGGFRTLYLGQPHRSNGIEDGSFARTDGPGLQSAVFVLDPQVAQRIRRLADHLADITEKGR